MEGGKELTTCKEYFFFSEEGWVGGGRGDGGGGGDRGTSLRVTVLWIVSTVMTRLCGLGVGMVKSRTRWVDVDEGKADRYVCK